MAQHPATPKTARMRHLVAARLLGPSRALRAADLQRSERAALNLRACGGAWRQRRAQHVHFLIPLVGAHQVGDWTGVQARLHATLDALHAQQNGAWRATICGQDAPALPDDPRIRFQPFTRAVDGNDKWAKLWSLYDALHADPDGPGYAMSFDADDIPHPGLVAEMLERQSAPGYLVAQGFVWNAGTGAIGRALPQSLFQPGAKAFWKLCGSCAALRYDPQCPESLHFLQAMSQHEHRMFPYLARLSGAPLLPLARSHVLYVLNHGENFGARRGRVAFKARYVDRFAVTDPKEKAALKAAYPILSAPRG